MLIKELFEELVKVFDGEEDPPLVMPESLAKKEGRYILGKFKPVNSSPPEHFFRKCDVCGKNISPKLIYYPVKGVPDVHYLPAEWVVEYFLYRSRKGRIFTFCSRECGGELIYKDRHPIKSFLKRLFGRKFPTLSELSAVDKDIEYVSYTWPEER